MSKTNSNQKTEKVKNDAKLALKFNIIIILSCFLLFLISIYIPDWCKYPIQSTFMLKTILPTVYFTVFSFFFGLIFLYGVQDMKPYLLDIINKEILDIGIIASYTGSIAIIASMFIKKILEHIIDCKIISTPVHDLVGFVMGRVCLLTMFYILNIPSKNTASEYVNNNIISS